MTIFRHELRQGRISLWIWTASIGFLMAMCIFLFPEMKGEMNEVGNMFGSMGSFSEAFGMDKISFGTLSGFYAIECGNILGLGGAFFAALGGITILAKEEKDHTAEFLLTHPVSRTRIILEKLLTVLIQIFILNLAVLIISFASIALIGEPLPCRELLLLHTAYFLLQVEIASICFGLSAFLRKGGMGIGLGIAAVFYFLNIIANISDSVDFLTYITPFSYAEGADIVSKTSLDMPLLLLGMLYAVVGITAAFLKYRNKDIL